MCVSQCVVHGVCVCDWGWGWGEKKRMGVKEQGVRLGNWRLLAGTPTYCEKLNCVW